MSVLDSKWATLTRRKLCYAILMYLAMALITYLCVVFLCYFVPLWGLSVSIKTVAIFDVKALLLTLVI